MYASTVPVYFSLLVQIHDELLYEVEDCHLRQAKGMLLIRLGCTPISCICGWTFCKDIYNTMLKNKIVVF